MLTENIISLVGLISVILGITLTIYNLIKAVKQESNKNAVWIAQKDEQYNFVINELKDIKAQLSILNNSHNLIKTDVEIIKRDVDKEREKWGA